MQFRARVVLLAVVAVFATGCSGAETTDKADPTPASGETTAPTEDVTVEPSGAPVPELGEALGSRQIVDEGWEMTLEMFPLQRDENGLVLNARLIYDTAGPEDRPPSAMLSNDGAMSRAFGAPNGFVLVDKAGGKAYLPAKDDGGSSMCSPDMGSFSPIPGDLVYVSCLFGAPPESTTTVDVRAAKFGVFSGVSIQ